MKPRPRGLCEHCRNGPLVLVRGICHTCYNKPDVRALYQPNKTGPKGCRNGIEGKRKRSVVREMKWLRRLIYSLREIGEPVSVLKRLLARRVCYLNLLAAKTTSKRVKAELLGING